MINKTLSVISKIMLGMGIVALIGIMVLAGYIISLFKSCKKTESKHIEDYYYGINTKAESPYAYIKELTEIGKSKEILIVPNKIDGYPVKRIFYKPGMWVSETSFDSNNLKKIYIPKVSYRSGNFAACTYLQKIILYENCSDIDLLINNSTKSIKAYINSFKYEKELYSGTNIYDEHLNHAEPCDCVNVYFANVSYMYNYENADNNGYYWIDDYDYGSKIEFIPDNPKREGYMFGGWYREPECINKWDFEIDTLPERGVVDNVVQYQETRLYAKWD